MTRELDDSFVRYIFGDDDSTIGDKRDALVATLEEVYGMSHPEAMENAEFLQRSSEPVSF